MVVHVLLNRMARIPTVIGFETNGGFTRGIMLRSNYMYLLFKTA
jgi:hypothetical protein